MVSVLAIGRKVRVFKLSRGNGFFSVIKIHGMPSFKREVKSLAPCCKIVWHVKNHFEVWSKML
jgi:hypothetical protein